MSEYICPHCKNPIFDDDALLCLYCGKSLERGFGFIGKLKYTKPKIVIFIVIIIVLASFLFLVLK